MTVAIWSPLHPLLPQGKRRHWMLRSPVHWNAGKCFKVISVWVLCLCIAKPTIKGFTLFVSCRLISLDRHACSPTSTYRFNATMQVRHYKLVLLPPHFRGIQGLEVQFSWPVWKKVINKQSTVTPSIFQTNNMYVKSPIAPKLLYY